MFKISQSKKQKGKYCCAYACTCEPVGKKGGLCHKHYARKIREEDPVQSRYNQFCSNATRRCKDNTITLEQFRQFCDDTGYMSKGRRGFAATIDRINNDQGYHIWNIQLLTHRQNSSKGTSDECPF